jgi:glutamyl-tRNA reductase
MNETGTPDINRFYAIGINYKKTDAAIRSRFAVSHAQYEAILTDAFSNPSRDLFILSTCNRTEIYGMAGDANQLIELLEKHTSGDPSLFRALAYIKQGADAIRHLFEVGAGLDSQILGDYEIIGQLKAAVRFAKERGFIGPFTERLVNSVLQASKQIKNQTQLSGGTVSVAFAAVQYIRNFFTEASGKNVLLIGTGKIGSNTCRNLQHYLPVKNITLMNRSVAKAADLAQELNVSFLPIEDLHAAINVADIIVVATNAEEPVLTEKELAGTRHKLVIDLSIPYNVADSVKTLHHITLVNVDDLSKVKDETLQLREAEIPKATAIISEYQEEFLTWIELRSHVHFLKAIKAQLHHIHTLNPFEEAALRVDKIQKVINGAAVKMRLHRNHGCQYIEAINEFMAPGVPS